MNKSLSSYVFPKSLRLRTRRDYQRMAQGSRRFSGQWINIEIRQNKNPLSKPRIGMTVTRRFGKAHIRNRFKRLVRESFRLSYASYPLGIDILVRPRPAAIQASFYDIQEELNVLVQKSKPSSQS